MPRRAALKVSPKFVESIRGLIAGAEETVARGVDLVQVYTNCEIGRRIVQEEQRGADRAAYGEQIVSELARQLTSEFGRGFSFSSLKSMRQFYLTYQERIGQSLVGQFINRQIDQSHHRYRTLQIKEPGAGGNHAPQRHQYSRSRISAIPAQQGPPAAETDGSRANRAPAQAATISPCPQPGRNGGKSPPLPF